MVLAFKREGYREREKEICDTDRLMKQNLV